MRIGRDLQLLRELRVLETIKEDKYLKTVFSPIHIFAINQEVIKLTSNLEYHQKTKHILIKYHKSQELKKDGSIFFDWVSIEKMLVNRLIKLLDTIKFQEFV